MEIPIKISGHGYTAKFDKSCFTKRSAILESSGHSVEHTETIRFFLVHNSNRSEQTLQQVFMETICLGISMQSM